MEIWAYNALAPSACVPGRCNVIHINRGIGTPTRQILQDITECIISDIKPKTVALQYDFG